MLEPVVAEKILKSTKSNSEELEKVVVKKGILDYDAAFEKMLREDKFIQAHITVVYPSFEAAKIDAAYNSRQ